MMTRTTQKIVNAMGILTAIGSLATVGYKLYQTVSETKTRKIESDKLDERLTDSMDASDATAVY